jgi:ribose-phosphate pyrophosphokinase
MQKINLIDLERSEVKYTLTTFPDGEPHIKLDPIDRKDNYQVVCRITNPNELFILMQVGNILNRQGVEWSLIISYLMSARMDRVISFNEAFTLEIVANIINSLNPAEVELFEVHSDRATKLIHNSHNKLLDHDFDGVTPCYPDHGAYDRYHDSLGELGTIILNKKRNLETGKIQSIEFARKTACGSSDIWVVDDLCDAGGTFVGSAKLLKEVYPNNKICICVAHLVNPVGLKNLAENFDKVVITNSYKDWDVTEFPNVNIIKIF